MGLFTGLTLLFVAAKLFGFITWSWWICFAPVAIGFTLIVGLFLIAAILKALTE